MISSVIIANGTTTTKAIRKTIGVNSACVVSLMETTFSVKSNNIPATINSKILSLVFSFSAILFNSVTYPIKKSLGGVL